MNKNKITKLSVMLAIVLLLSLLTTGLAFAQTTSTGMPSLNVANSFSLVSGSGTYGGLATLTATLQSGTTPLAGKKIIFRLNSKKVGMAFTDANGVATAACRLGKTNAGNYPAAVGVYFAGDADYAASSGSGPLDVAKKDIVITADSKSILLGAEIPRLTYHADFKGRRCHIKGITISTEATPASPAGIYAITVSGPATTVNLNISYVPGTLTISAEPLAATSIQISGPDTLTIPTIFKNNKDKHSDKHKNWRQNDCTPEGTLNNVRFKAKVLDQYGNPLRGEKVAWSLLAPVAGVTIQPESGIVKLTGEVVPGTFTVVATAGSLTGSKLVNLVAATPVAVTSVAFKKPSVTVYIGKTKALRTIVLPCNATNKAVTWLSSDLAIATIDADGKVTGISAGTATITVTTVDGAFSATCLVTVEAAPVDEPDTDTCPTEEHSRSGSNWNRHDNSNHRRP